MLSRHRFLLVAGILLTTVTILAGLPTQSPAAAQSSDANVIIQNAFVSGEPVYFPSMGDLWMSTWSQDDLLYFTWGDGTGFGDGFPTGFPYYQVQPTSITSSCMEFDMFCELWCNMNACDGQAEYARVPLTDAGLLAFQGDVPDFVDVFIRSIDVPSGEPFFRETADGPADIVGTNDKPSSLLAVGGRLYFAGHYPAVEPTMGYVAVSEDGGLTWTTSTDSPWGADSNFRVLMFINMGQDYALNTDGFVYALGIGSEGMWESGAVYLARVPVDAISNYDAFEYFVDLTESGPLWSLSQADAGALPGLFANLQGSAIYHPGTERYLFMTASVLDPPGGAGGLFEAPSPWGPWTQVATLCFDYGCEMPPGTAPSWQDGKYIAGLIPKGAGPDSVYFSISGGDTHYQLQIGELVFELE